ncbi:26644_t:CDS:2, partial [Racocetra persica]
LHNQFCPISDRKIITQSDVIDKEFNVVDFVNAANNIIEINNCDSPNTNTNSKLVDIVANIVIIVVADVVVNVGANVVTNIVV